MDHEDSPEIAQLRKALGAFTTGPNGPLVPIQITGIEPNRDDEDIFQVGFQQTMHNKEKFGVEVRRTLDEQSRPLYLMIDSDRKSSIAFDSRGIKVDSDKYWQHYERTRDNEMDEVRRSLSTALGKNRHKVEIPKISKERYGYRAVLVEENGSDHFVDIRSERMGKGRALRLEHEGFNKDGHWIIGDEWVDEAEKNRRKSLDQPVKRAPKRVAKGHSTPDLSNNVYASFEGAYPEDVLAVQRDEERENLYYVNRYSPKGQEISSTATVENVDGQNVFYFDGQYHNASGRLIEIDKANPSAPKIKEKAVSSKPKRPSHTSPDLSTDVYNAFSQASKNEFSTVTRDEESEHLYFVESTNKQGKTTNSQVEAAEIDGERIFLINGKWHDAKGQVLSDQTSLKGKPLEGVKGGKGIKPRKAPISAWQDTPTPKPKKRLSWSDDHGLPLETDEPRQGSLARRLDQLKRRRDEQLPLERGSLSDSPWLRTSRGWRQQAEPDIDDDLDFEGGFEEDFYEPEDYADPRRTARTRPERGSNWDMPPWMMMAMVMNPQMMQNFLMMQMMQRFFSQQRSGQRFDMGF